MVETPASPLPPAAPPSRWRRLMPVAFAALAGALIGIRLVRPGPSPFRPALLLSPMMIAVAMWLVMSIYWEIEARKRSAARAAESGGSRAVHLVMISAAQLLTFWPFPGWIISAPIALQFPRVLPAWPFLAPLGLALTAAGVGFAMWSRRQLGRNWSGEVTVKVGHELVRSGPYRWIRHPIYTGLFAMYIGTALVSGRLQGPIAVALVAIAYARKIPQEERVLGAEFGAAYEEYRRASKALIPGIL